MLRNGEPMSLLGPLFTASTLTPIFSISPARETWREMTPIEPVIEVGCATITSAALAR
jgi:hypothetical protein